MLKQILEEAQNEKDYQAFFKAKLKKYNVKSQSQLKGADKKKFYDEVDKEWDAESESD